MITEGHSCCFCGSSKSIPKVLRPYVYILTWCGHSGTPRTRSRVCKPRSSEPLYHSRDGWPVASEEIGNVDSGLPSKKHSDGSLPLPCKQNRHNVVFFYQFDLLCVTQRKNSMHARIQTHGVHVRKFRTRRYLPRLRNFGVLLCLSTGKVDILYDIVRKRPC